jgi:lon-related putative ATP-dependent protease
VDAIDRPRSALPAALPAEQLYRRTDLSGLAFATTAELQPADGLIGQQRALEALKFGTRIEKPGFNLFVVGSSGNRMQQAVQSVLETTEWNRPAPSDWVYVNNFEETRKPIGMQLPPGRAAKLRDAMREVVDDLKTALPALFESEDFQTRRNAIDQTFQSKQGEAFSALGQKAASKNLALVRTPMGFVIAPVRDGKIVPPEDFNKWSEAERNTAQEAIDELQKELERIVLHIPQWEKERRDQIRKLNRETAMLTVGQTVAEAKAKFGDIPNVLKYLEAVRADLIENVPLFVVKPEGDGFEAVDTHLGSPFDRYAVNVLVSHSDTDRPIPIVEELHPTLANLVGSIEYVSQNGVLVTNFRLIKAGAIHCANGGFLLLDVRHLLTEPFSWPALKRIIRQREIRIEDIGRFMGFTSTVSLEPDPIPLDLKVILFGDRLLYYLLCAYDPEVSEFFKVLADFEDDIDRTPNQESAHARMIAAMVQREKLRPIDRDGVALVLEHAARLADDARKLTLLVDQIKDVLTEADFWATESRHTVVARADVQRALDERTARMSRLRDRAHESILRELALIETSGRTVGQINGLSVIELGGFRFGRPSRITCRVRPGGGKVVDIEREVELGGPLHSKGVLILSGFLAGRYALETPMSLFASLVFEQSYGGVEGDSASSAELYALLSALSGLPLRQDLAVTGSVNQHGEVQPIGGVNEKIEGFFDICKARDFTGTQGVLIPKSNVQHLMLRSDVVDACAAGKFSVFPITTTDEGIAVLTGHVAGQRAADGGYTAGSVNRLVEDRLRAFARIRHEFGQSSNEAPAHG